MVELRYDVGVRMREEQVAFFFRGNISTLKFSFKDISETGLHQDCVI